MRGRVISILVCILVSGAAVQAAGTVTEETMFSEALGENREVLVYLPEGYETSGLDYPVIYYLHGSGGEPGHWYLTDYFPTLDALIADGMVEPAIVVEPDSASRSAPLPWMGQGVTGRVWHFHANSELLGNNEDYLAEDLVAWVDDTYRSVPDRDHRLIVARSMGGHGAMRLTMRHPETFAGASIDAGYMAVAEGEIPVRVPWVVSNSPGPPYNFAPTDGFVTSVLFEFCAAFTPNMSNPPWYVDFIIKPDGTLDQEVYDRLLAESPPTLVAEYAGSDYPLDLFLRIGNADGYRTTFWPVIDALEANGVPHLVRTFAGSHSTPALKEKIAVQMSYFFPLNATVEISPGIADPRLYPQLLRVAVELPGDLDVADIDCSTLTLVDIEGNRLDCPIRCADVCEISDVNGNGRSDLSLWLPSDRVVRAATAVGAEAGDQIGLTIRGELTDDRFFQATDTVTLASMPTTIAVD